MYTNSGRFLQRRLAFASGNCARVVSIVQGLCTLYTRVNAEQLCQTTKKMQIFVCCVILIMQNNNDNNNNNIVNTSSSCRSRRWRGEIVRGASMECAAVHIGVSKMMINYGIYSQCWRRWADHFTIESFESRLKIFAGVGLSAYAVRRPMRAECRCRISYLSLLSYLSLSPTFSRVLWLRCTSKFQSEWFKEEMREEG